MIVNTTFSPHLYSPFSLVWEKNSFGNSSAPASAGRQQCYQYQHFFYVSFFTPEHLCSTSSLSEIKVPFSVMCAGPFPVFLQKVNSSAPHIQHHPGL